MVVAAGHVMRKRMKAHTVVAVIDLGMGIGSLPQH
jgi:hypothetical protein